MHMNTLRISSILALAATSIALAHGHITVDTASGTPGDRISARVGYLPAESSYGAMADGTLTYGASPWRMNLLTAVTTVLLVGVGKFSRFRRSVVLSWSLGV